MFESTPVSNFLANRSSWALVSRKGIHRGTLSGRNWAREDSSSHSSSPATFTAVRLSTSAYSSYEPLWISCWISMNRGISTSRSMVKPSRSASFWKAS